MKKLLGLSLTLLSTAVFATEKPQTPTTQAKGQPTVILQVLDFSGKTPRVMKENKLSRSNKNHKLCWATINLPVSGMVRIAETFHTPAPSNFKSTGMSIHASNGNKTFLIVGDVRAKNNENVQRCWRFDNSDPLGKYQFEVQVSDYLFKGLGFEIVK